METLFSRTQGVFLTAILLANEAALTEWQRLPDPVRRAESKVRSVAAAQLDRTAGLLTGGTAGEPGDLEVPPEVWNVAASHSSSEILHHDRTYLLRRLTTQTQQVGRQRKPG